MNLHPAQMPDGPAEKPGAAKTNARRCLVHLILFDWHIDGKPEEERYAINIFVWAFKTVVDP